MGKCIFGGWQDAQRRGPTLRAHARDATKELHEEAYSGDLVLSLNITAIAFVSANQVVTRPWILTRLERRAIPAASEPSPSLSTRDHTKKSRPTTRRNGLELAAASRMCTCTQ